MLIENASLMPLAQTYPPISFTSCHDSPKPIRTAQNPPPSNRTPPLSTFPLPLPTPSLLLPPLLITLILLILAIISIILLLIIIPSLFPTIPPFHKCNLPIMASIHPFKNTCVAEYVAGLGGRGSLYRMHADGAEGGCSWGWSGYGVDW